jgi:hypothetical protein
MQNRNDEIALLIVRYAIEADKQLSLYPLSSKLSEKLPYVEKYSYAVIAVNRST